MKNPSRRNVLKATAAVGIAASAAGCSSVPLVGGSSGPCSDAESLFEAFLDGDQETALEYVPYEYDPDMSEDDARAEFDMADFDEIEEMMDEMDMEIDFSCDCSEELDDDEIDQLGIDFGDHEITAAAEILTVTHTTAEFMGEEIDETEEEIGHMIEVDGDGWYIWETDQEFGKC